MFSDISEAIDKCPTEELPKSPIALCFIVFNCPSRLITCK